MINKIKCPNCLETENFSADKSRCFNSKYGKRLTYYTCDNCGERLSSYQLAGYKAAKTRKQNKHNR